mmetsp:Transcript_18264/g.45382  ORF Transcript_18264/g.45382 Transcript_18264/m.45382 type:complete len:150 (+) Transcript_18264:2-451(+)
MAFPLIAALALGFSAPQGLCARSAVGRVALPVASCSTGTMPARARFPPSRGAGVRMAGGDVDDFVEYTTRMIGFGASATLGLFYTIFIGPVQAFMRNPRTSAIAAVGVGIFGVLLLLTLRAMFTGEVDLPREVVEQADFNSFQPPQFPK